MATYEMRLRVTDEANINVANNTSDVTVALEFRRTDYYYWGQSSNDSAYWEMTVDGQTYTEHFNFNWNVPQNEWKELGSHTFTITHNPDGSKIINMSGEWYSGDGVKPGTVTGSGTATLQTIPRASSFGTISGNTIGSQISVAVNAASSSFTHKFWYRVGGSGWIEASLTFTPPLSLCSQVPNATSATMELRLRTMSGSTQIGSDVYKNITVYVPANVKPSISTVNITEAVSGLNAQFGAYVQSKSKLRVKTTAAGAQGSTIKTVRVTVQNSSYYGSDVTTGVLTQSGTITVSVTVTDSRGRTATSAPTVTVVAYQAIVINKFMAKRCNADGTANDGGTALSIQSKYDIAAVGSRNTGVYKIEIQEKGTTSWTTLKSENSTNDPYSYDGTLTTAVNTAAVDKAYTLKLTVTDYFGSAAAFTEVGTVFRTMNVNASKKGVALGKFSEKNAFENNLPDGAEFLTGLKVKKNDELIDAKRWLYYAKGDNDSQNGLLVRTNMPTESNALFLVTIKGYGHSDGNIYSIYQGFHNHNNSDGSKFSSNTLQGIHLGIRPLIGFTVFYYDGNICFWFPPNGRYQTFYISVIDGDTGNRAISVANEPLPSGITEQKSFNDIDIRKDIGVRKILGDTENLNNLTAPGVYVQYISNYASTSRNYPVALAGNLEVLYSGTRTTYIWQRYSTFNNTGVYVRTYYNGTWYAWAKLATTANIPTVLTGTNYTAIKYPNGIMQLTQDIDAGSVALTTAWGNLWSNSANLGNWAIAFTDVPKIISVINNSTNDDSYWFAGWVIRPTKTAVGTVDVARGGSGITTTVKFTVTAIGKYA